MPVTKGSCQPSVVLFELGTIVRRRQVSTEKEKVYTITKVNADNLGKARRTLAMLHRPPVQMPLSLA